MKRTLIKSCCGGSGYVFELDSPITKAALPTFIQEGYATSETYTRVGVFYITKSGITASGPFGGTKIQVRCGGSANCSTLIDHLENTFKMLDMSK